jgi:hypothetical protein
VNQVAVVCQSPHVLKMLTCSVEQTLRQHVIVHIVDSKTDTTTSKAKKIAQQGDMPVIAVYEEHQRAAPETLAVREEIILRTAKSPVLALYASWVFMQTDPIDIDVAIKYFVSGGTNPAELEEQLPGGT